MDIMIVEFEQYFVKVTPPDGEPVVYTGDLMSQKQSRMVADEIVGTHPNWRAEGYEIERGVWEE